MTRFFSLVVISLTIVANVSADEKRSLTITGYSTTPAQTDGEKPKENPIPDYLVKIADDKFLDAIHYYEAILAYATGPDAVFIVATDVGHLGKVFEKRQDKKEVKKVEGELVRLMTLIAADLNVQKITADFHEGRIKGNKWLTNHERSQMLLDLEKKAKASCVAVTFFIKMAARDNWQIKKDEEEKKK